MKTSRYSKPAATLAFAAILGGCVLLAPTASPEAAPARAVASAVATKPAQGKTTQGRTTQDKAAPKASEAKKTAPAEASNEPQYASASLGQTPAADTTACQRPRKRLWVEGEGWIVRRVTLCP